MQASYWRTKVLIRRRPRIRTLNNGVRVRHVAITPVAYNSADHHIGTLSPCVASIVELLAEFEPLTMAEKWVGSGYCTSTTPQGCCQALSRSGGSRTHGLMVPNHPLYHLSYTSIKREVPVGVEPTNKGFADPSPADEGWNLYVLCPWRESNPRCTD